MNSTYGARLSHVTKAEPIGSDGVDGIIVAYRIPLSIQTTRESVSRPLSTGLMFLLIEDINTASGHLARSAGCSD
jgi:hypothetical protein